MKRRGIIFAAVGLVVAAGITVTATSAGTTAPATTTTVSPAPGVTLRTVDGGADYYTKFANPLPSSPGFFPIAVWYESVLSSSDAAIDKDAGLNTYVELTEGSRGDLVRAAGMNTLTSGGIQNQGSEARGWLTGDEVDMTGSGWWAAPNQAQFDLLARQVAALPKDGRARITNFGKGIVFGGPGEDAAAARMLTDYQDIVSADVYWMTDSDVYSINQGGQLLGKKRDLTATETRLAANYGVVVQKLRRLLNYSKPVWGFTEVGGPFPYNTTAGSNATPAEVRASVWSQIINGARGIIYFNHSFGGPAQTQHALREAYYAPVRAVVKATNKQITRLAPVLNGPTIRGLASTTGEVDVLTKKAGGDVYLFVGSKQPAAQTVTINLTCAPAASAEVDGEARSVPVTSGRFSDSFADGNAVHIYRLPGGAAACGI